MGKQVKHTILCVDDEQHILSSLKRLLRNEHFDLLTATDPEQGLRIMASQDIHLVMSDHRMPGMSGISFLTKVKEVYPDTIRILLTGYTEVDSIKASINEGQVYKFLLKPWDDDNLKQEIRKSLEHYDLIQANQVLNRMVAEKNKELELINKNLESIIEKRIWELEHQNQILDLTRALFRELPVAAVGISFDGTIILVNKKAEELKINRCMVKVGNPLAGYFSKTMMEKFSMVFESQADQITVCMDIDKKPYIVTLLNLTGRFYGKCFILCLQEQAG